MTRSVRHCDMGKKIQLFNGIRFNSGFLSLSPNVVAIQLFHVYAIPNVVRFYSFK